LETTDDTKNEEYYQMLLSAIAKLCKYIPVDFGFTHDLKQRGALGEANYKSVFVSANEDIATQGKAALHELAHQVLGHVKISDTNSLKTSDLEFRECEANSVEYMVAQNMGILYNICDYEDLMLDKKDLIRVAMEISEDIKRVMSQPQSSNAEDCESIEMEYMVEFMEKVLTKFEVLSNPHKLDLLDYAKELLTDGWWVRSPY